MWTLGWNEMFFHTCPRMPFAFTLSPATGLWLSMTLCFVERLRIVNTFERRKEVPLQSEDLQKQQHDRVPKHMALSLKLDLTTSLSSWALTSLLCTSIFLTIKWLMIVSTSWLWWSVLTTNEALKGRAHSIPFCMNKNTETPRPEPGEAWQSPGLAMFQACSLQKQHLITMHTSWDKWGSPSSHYEAPEHIWVYCHPRFFVRGKKSFLFLCQMAKGKCTFQSS